MSSDLRRLALVLPLLGGCSGLNLSQAFVIDRLRVLAVAAEPAEPQPGDTVTFSSLVVSPVTPVGLTTWLACAGTTSCEIDEDLLATLSGDTSELTDEELAALFAQLQAAGLIGVEPFFSPVWTVPSDFLDGLAEADKAEGTAAVVTVTAIPTVEGDTATLSSAQEDIEIAYKRVPVSLATTPNHNPTITGFRVDGVELVSGATVHLTPGQTYAIEILVPETAIETYNFVNEDGATEQRVEEPYFSWYLQEGGFDQAYTLYPYTSVDYTAPTEPTLVEQSLWVVVRDRRGGMAWAELPLRFD